MSNGITCVCLSDTHSRHEGLVVPDGDILLHSGDYSMMGYDHEVRAFLIWYERQPHAFKILTNGNHEVEVEANYPLFRAMLKEYAPSVIYLNDSGANVMGLKLWGSAVTPRFGYGWAWNCDRGADIARHWDMIPTDTDVLITHGPPHGINDRLERGEHVGCEDLRRTIDERLDDLKLSVAGHLHSAYGRDQIGGKTFVNASVVNERYELTNAPVVVEIEA